MPVRGECPWDSRKGQVASGPAPSPPAKPRSSHAPALRAPASPWDSRRGSWRMKALLIPPHGLEKTWLRRRGWSSERAEELCRSEDARCQVAFPPCRHCQPATGPHRQPSGRHSVPCPEGHPSPPGGGRGLVTAAPWKRLLGSCCPSAGRSQGSPGFASLR